MSDIVLFDYDMFGQLDNENNIQTYINAEALQNAIRIWFCSSLGGRLRNPQKGGLLDFQVTKMMDEESLSLLRNRTAKALQKEFDNIFEVLYISFTPLEDRRTLEIDLGVSSNRLDTSFDLTLRINTNGVT